MQEPNKPIWFNKSIAPFSLFVATPVHSEVSIHYAQALLELQKVCMSKKIPIAFQLMKSSLVTHGRNMCVSAFLESGLTHLLFIDSDISFEPESIMKLVAADKGVISIPYPLKSMMWEKVLEKIQKGDIKTVSDLESAAVAYPLKIENQEDITMSKGIMEVTHAPTGCMLIKRSVFDTLITTHGHLFINQKAIMNGKVVDRPYMYNFFDTLFNPEDHTYLGEDYAFCKRWSETGGKCYALTTESITHTGEHNYKGRFMDELIKIDDIDI
jgi:hypothetical protein|tara:strand:+ start:63 stop:869 length:807 start_codon:yes stop_codon:yes gene_type:complete